MKKIVESYLGIIVFLVYVLVDKGIRFVLSHNNLIQEPESFFSIESIILLVISAIELVVISMVILISVDDNIPKALRIVNAIFAIILSLLALIGIASHYELII